MAKQTMKALRETAEAMLEAGISNKQQLLAAVPAVVALQDATRRLGYTLNAAKDVVRRLVEACSDYAHEHPEHVFDETFSVTPVGVESGDLAIEGRIYHYSRGVDGFVRTEPGVLLTQEFIRGLPEGWTKEKAELDLAGIKSAAPDAETLEAAGLRRKIKCCWSLLQQN